MISDFLNFQVPVWMVLVPILIALRYFSTRPLRYSIGSYGKNELVRDLKAGNRRINIDSKLGVVAVVRLRLFGKLYLKHVYEDSTLYWEGKLSDFLRAFEEGFQDPRYAHASKLIQGFIKHQNSLAA